MEDYKPIYRVIIELMEKTADKDLYLVAFLIKTVEIKKKHDLLIAAWKKRLAKAGQASEDLLEVIGCLERKKKEREAELANTV